MTQRLKINTVRQVCLVVEDCDQTIRDLYETVGVGPWAVWTPKLTDTRVRGASTHYTMRLALAWTKDFMWEVIQPLEGRSIYREFLDSNGDGVHHMLVQADESFDQIVSEENKRGSPPLMEGTWGLAKFAYLATEKPCRTIIEVSERLPGYVRPKPDYFYPREFELPT
ncbi:VOC family protein [Tardiphaga sp. 538_B7_N1_4]|jgi:hypothetical protein|uniref:VOC family protein n=1 Tax=Tardiphaga sp. 538_B7_N1_4 TaxID=3240778 RepID=UPI001B8A0443|nr:VOC family protein [Bradyrhizobium diazoefficiens]MBR0967328.1 VOC family protein [Bradyrhizobium diazoefficiens]MBR0976649.1 VOC family protein [Bradyrhizobium diazoefficiens]MBR1005294.1 VOC family protein [Bradyrhizobium diazoefficiens]MBR1011767.1 VOC family protein [Bradyrhizobium diazoefficiens]MBR1049108.1 VOC family protein [Bradyrhizobium diazoefficiens]